MHNTGDGNTHLDNARGENMPGRQSTQTVKQFTAHMFSGLQHLHPLFRKVHAGQSGLPSMGLGK
jgi:hypothetical protein